MSFKRKQLLLDRKTSFEQELKDRLAGLAEKGIKPPKADKYPLIKKIKAEIKALKRRLARIDEIGKRTEEMARIKAEKAAAPKNEPVAGKSEKPKAAPQEAKAKKPKSPEGAKAPKKAEAAGADKAAPPKKAEE
jgi:hypothetical protein